MRQRFVRFAQRSYSATARPPQASAVPAGTAPEFP